MADIIIYTRPNVLEHKKKEGERPNAYCYWELKNLPKKLRKEIEQPLFVKRESTHSDEITSYIFHDNPYAVIRFNLKLYFAVKGNIVGYFPLIAVKYPKHHIDLFELRFHSDDWTEIKPIPCKAFQGFKYFENGKRN
jgi:hypothetical protein